MTPFSEKFVGMAMRGTQKGASSSDDDQYEHHLLLSVGIDGLGQRAGYIPAIISAPLPPQVPPADSKACSLNSQQHLKVMLNPVQDNLLPDWIDALYEHQQHIPSEMLPTVLEYGNQQTRHQQLLRSKLDERGRWLARISNKTEWHWLLRDDPPEQRDGVYIAWGKHFKRMRQRDPIHALDIIETHWDDLNLLMQMSILNAMDVGLNSHDTDFLMRSLPNKVKGFTAGRLLLNIEDSDFSNVVYDRIRQLLILMPIGDDGEWVIDFTWSATFKGHPAYISYEQAKELCHIMGHHFAPEDILKMIPLSYWYETYNISPETLVISAENSTRPSTFFRMWSESAIKRSDRDFLFALIMRVKRHADPSLMAQLTQAQLMQAAIHWLKQDPIFSVKHNAVNLLRSVHQTWSIDLATVFLTSLKNCFTRLEHPLLDTDIWQLLQIYARSLPLEASQAFEDVLNTNQHDALSKAEKKLRDTIMTIVRFRADMLKAIKAGAPVPSQEQHTDE